MLGGRSAAVVAIALAVVVLVWPQSPGHRVALAGSSPLRAFGPGASKVPARAQRVLVEAASAPHPLTRAISAAGGPLVIASYQQALINSDRARAGLAPLTWSACLQPVAVANARRMAAQNYISHTNGAWLDLACHLGRQGGENVGWWSEGIDDAQLNSMFMASPDHRANIMGPYHYVATAWAVAANGYAYIAVEFA